MREVARRWAGWLGKHSAVVIPALVALVCIVPTVRALHAMTFATFGRDQGIFQYVAWALKNGARAYRDIHEINGPLPHAWHMAMQALGGEDEHVFRSVDTLGIVLVYGLATLTLPQWLGLASRWPSRIAWALAGVGFLGAQYARYDWWHTSQREGFYSVLLFASLALQAVAHPSRVPRRALACFGGAAALTALTWFGKPPCVVFALLQAVVVVLDRKSLSVPLSKVLIVASGGAAAATIAMLAFVLRHGDFEAAYRVLSSVPVLHHTIWNKSLLECYRAYGNAPRLDWAMATLFAFVLGYFALKLPRRALLALVLPLGGAALFLGQGKGFPYHMHMLTLGTAVAQLLLVLAVAEHAARRREVFLAAGVVGAIALGFKASEDARYSPSTRGRWDTYGETAEQRASRAYFERFEWGDFFAADLRDAAQFLREATPADQRVQLYGFDPYLLFLAKRHSASPVIYGFELNVDAALAGGSGARPSEAQRAALLAHRDASEALVLRSARERPPAAFVFFDRAPFSYPEDSELDFARHCPELHAWLGDRYDEAVRFGTIRVRLRRDLAAAAARTPRRESR